MGNRLRALIAPACLALVGACCPPAVADTPVLSPGAHAFVSQSGGALAERFDSAWRLVAERYWDLSRLPVDWDEVGERYRARLVEVDDAAGLYRLLEEMYEEIGDHHSVYVPPERVAEIREAYGDMPCVAVFGSAASSVPTATPLLSDTLTRTLVTVGAGLLSAQAPPRQTDSIGKVTFGMASAPFQGSDVAIGYIRLPDLASD